MSLQWHPDKNASVQDTTTIFQQIQEAYRVLSDPQERAWYDKHRVQILQGDRRATQMGAPSDFQEERIDVYSFVTRSCFDEFDDGPRGFYTVYRKLFEDLTDEEIKAASFTNSKPTHTDDDESDDGDLSDATNPTAANSNRKSNNKSRKYPSFGYANSSYTDVVAPFYLFWEVFETQKSYTWVEKYDTRCAGSRAEKRAMESENRRLCEAARRERNDEIRKLVAYVKKRDKRVQTERERIQQANQAAEARARTMTVKAKERDATRLAQAWEEELAVGGLTSQWAEQFEEELARLEAQIDGLPANSMPTNYPTPNKEPMNSSGDQSQNETDNNELNELYCIACDKLFASANAKTNHELSKKHRKQVQLLREALLDEEAAILNQLDLSLPTDQPNCSQPEIKLTKRAKKAENRRRREAAASTKLTDQNDGSDVQLSQIEELRLDESGRKPTDLDHGPTSSIQPDSNPEPVQSRSTAIKCDTCSETFDSRNHLFKHLNETGHAKLKSVGSTKSTSSSATKSRPKCKRK